MTDSNQDVVALIVGAGPTGLTMAGELARHGVPFRIIDRRPGPSQHSKALAVHTRTLEVFEDMGFVERLLEKGHKLHDGNLYAAGRRILSFSFDEIESGFPFVLSVPQRETKLALEAHLNGMGGEVEREVELVGLKQAEGQVMATIRGADDRKQEVTVRWLIGCDGAHSSVRKLAGMEFEGTQDEQIFAIADGKLAWDYSDDGLHTFFSDQGVLVFIPMPGGLYRVIINLPTNSDRDGDPTWQEIQYYIDRRGPGKIQFSDLGWSSRFKIHYRLVQHYRNGNVFLAGDAAHIHSPAGGQGMNTGIQDVYNLAWKLALVVRGQAAPELLESYEGERRDIAKNLLDSTERLTKVATLRHPVAQTVRNQVMSFLSHFEVIQQRVSRDLSMVGLNYRNSPIVSESRESIAQVQLNKSVDEERPSFGQWRDFAAGPKAGDRAPDRQVTVESKNQSIRLYQLLQGTQHNLLLFDGQAPTRPGYRNLEEIRIMIRNRFSDLIPVHMVVPRRLPPEDLKWFRSLILDDDGDLHHHYGAAAECLYLIRPDNYIGFRCQPADGVKLADYLEGLKFGSS